jgi:hypothetical protein
MDDRKPKTLRKQCKTLIKRKTKILRKTYSIHNIKWIDVHRCTTEIQTEKSDRNNSEGEKDKKKKKNV